MLKNIHDNEIISYTINLKKHEIIFNTINSKGEAVNIIFQKTLVHRFETEMTGSVIFDIEKVDIEKFIIENAELLEENKKNCWPILYNNTNELLKKLQLENYNYYVISSSYGLYGWILAKKIFVN